MSPIHIRFKNFAPTLYRLGHPSVIPIIEGQKRPDTHVISDVLAKSWPDIADGQTWEEVEKVAARCADGDGIGAVMDGRYVMIDSDIKIPPNVSPRDKRRISLAAHKVREITQRRLGHSPARRSECEKTLFIYAQKDPNTVETIAGDTVEIFATAKSKQLVLYGRHPSGNEYRWDNDKGPANTGFSQLTKVGPDQVYAAWREISIILSDEGLNKPRTPQSLKPNAHGLNDPHVCSNGVSALLSQLLAEFADKSNVPIINISVDFLTAAVPGARSNTAAACISALVLRGYDDATIIMNLEPIYKALFAVTGERPVPLRNVLSGIRRRMSSINGSDILSLTDLDRALDTSSWSLFS